MLASANLKVQITGPSAPWVSVRNASAWTPSTLCFETGYVQGGSLSTTVFCQSTDGNVSIPYSKTTSAKSTNQVCTFRKRMHSNVQACISL
jgi:hypothetical protein